MNVNVRRRFRSGAILLAVTVASAAAAGAAASTQIRSAVGPLPPQPSPCFNVRKPCQQRMPPVPAPRPRHR